LAGSRSGNFAEQEEQFAAAVEKEPKNDLYQFNLAALQIHSRDAERQANARETLQRLSKVAAYRTGAVRDCLAMRSPQRPRRRRQFCAATPNVARDHIWRLSALPEILSEARRKIPRATREGEALCSRDPGDVASLIDWMNETGSLATS
jgi:hypothetical protein